MANYTYTDKQLMKLSLDELKKVVSQEKQKVKKDYKELEKKRKLIEKYKKMSEIRNKIKQGKVKKIKPKFKPKKLKTFEDYFEECIKNKKIPKDTPPYLRKALERVMREYQQGIVIEKSSLDGFAKKYIIKGEPGVLPNQFFIDKYPIIKEFLKNHRNTKVKFILDVIMERVDKISKESVKTLIIQDHIHIYTY